MKKKIIAAIACIAAAITAILPATACSSNKFDPDKQITVVARTKTSGTREAFDTVVTDGTNHLLDKVNGEKVFRTTDKAVCLEETAGVITKVTSDKQAIGYISLGSVNDTFKVIKVGGVTPSKATVLDHSYKIQRPFVLVTKKGITHTPVAEDFIKFLKSASAEALCDKAGTVYLSDPAMRANTGKDPIAVEKFEKQATLPSGGKIIIRGSTSMEKLITLAAKAYADLYGVNGADLFDIEVKGSSVGVSEAEKDTAGNVIGMSSAKVDKDALDSFNICLDAVAVIVNNDNDIASDLTLAQLYDVYTGKITKFSELAK